MRVAVIHVGSSAIRLLVADPERSRLHTAHVECTFLGLGEEVEHLGRISLPKLALAGELAGGYAQRAREHGAASIEIVVTGPGRTSPNGADLVSALVAATRARVRVLALEEQAKLGYEGALAARSALPHSAAVCHVGGTATTLVVGTASGPAWLRSFDVGSLGLTSRFLGDDPPGKRAVAAARADAQARLDGFAPPLPVAAVAIGGTASALGALVGPRLGRAQLASAVRRLTRRPASEIARRHDIVRPQARILAAGALVLAELERRLGLPFFVSRAGVPEGVALALLEDVAAA